MKVSQYALVAFAFPAVVAGQFLSFDFDFGGFDFIVGLVDFFTIPGGPINEILPPRPRVCPRLSAIPTVPGFQFFEFLIGVTAADTCLVPDDTIACGRTFTGPVTLDGNLICDPLFFLEGGPTRRDLQFIEDQEIMAAITLNGPDAVLDCNGFSVSGEGRPPAEFFLDLNEEAPLILNSLGVRLRNGASAINCQVSGFLNGILMESGDNVVANTVVFKNFDDGIELTSRPNDVDCKTISNVQCLANGGDGIDAEDIGTLVLDNVESSYNDGDGINVDAENNLVISAENFAAVGNGDDGISIDIDTGNFRTVDLELFGNTAIKVNGGRGIDFDDGGDLRVFGDVLVQGNADDGVGIEEDSTLFIASSATLTSCNNGQFDFVGDNRDKEDVDDRDSDASFIIEGTLICRTKDGPFDCEDLCNQKSRVDACTFTTG